jgi:hypothetical protein
MTLAAAHQGQEPGASRLRARNAQRLAPLTPPKERGVLFGRPHKMPHQRQEALQRLAGGETYADLARAYNVDATTIGRLATASPFAKSAAGP